MALQKLEKSALGLLVIRLNETETTTWSLLAYRFANMFTSPYSGLAQVIKPDGLYTSQQRFGLYRWHIADPIRFRQDLRVTIQALGWRDWPRGFETGPRCLPLQDDIASTVYWYQTEPHGKYPTLPDVNDLDVN